jgi:hypothetical protein
MSDSAGEAGDRTVRAELEIEAGHSVVRVTGERDAALVVESESGERIYLPPEDAAEEDPTPYAPDRGDSPYEGLQGDESPYGSSRRSDPSIGMNPTANGFRVVHPEPVTDVRLLR